jgi:hypothetical protein
VLSLVTAPTISRWLCTAFAALLLALRLLTPAGFMPAFDHGAVTIIVCPDANGDVPMHMHKHGDQKNLHRPCPYASASALGALGPDWGSLLLTTFFAVALIVGRTFVFLERHATRDRPPARGPPIPA